MRIALVTGASGGIGSVVAKNLCKEGYFVYLHYNSSVEQAHSIKQSVQREGGSIALIQADLRKEEEVQQMFQVIQVQQGRLDVLINNAGTERPSEIRNMSVQAWRNIIATNLTGSFLCIKYGIDLLEKSERNASILNISSRLADRPFLPKTAAYAASKAGVEALTKHAAKEFQEQGIRVNCLRIGSINAGLTKKYNADSPEFGEPEQVAGVVSFLCSEKAAHINGAIIKMDGGQTL